MATHAGAQLIPGPAIGACATQSARPPTLPPSAYCLPLVRPTFVEGLPPDVREYAHTGTHRRSVFDLDTMATRAYIIIVIIDIYYSLHGTVLSSDLILFVYSSI